MAALKRAGKALDRLLEARHVDIDEFAADFKAARRKTTLTKKAGVKPK
jgi:hypothetical protein